MVGTSGLRSGRRHAGHLSTEEGTARTFGRRHGRWVALRVDAAAAVAAGLELSCSANGVWLVPAVPAAYLSVHFRAG